MSNLLVVGGAGYVGTVLVPVLLQHGHSVRVLDRFYYGRRALEPVLKDIEVVCADMRQVPDSALAGVDVVLNLGGLSNDPTANYNPEANWAMNYEAVVSLARRCKQLGVNRYIFGSSCSVYDRRTVTEDMDTLQTEESPLEPVGYYAEAKYAAERELLGMTDDTFHTTILRKGTVFGYSPRMRLDLVVNTMVRDAIATGFINLHGGGEMWRPLVSVRDAARAYTALVEAPVATVHGEIFNLVYANLRISEVGLRVHSVLRSLGIPCEIKADYTRPGARNYRVSGSKLAKALSFVPTVSIEEAVAEMASNLQAVKSDLSNPRYFNIRWMEVLEEAAAILKGQESAFSPAR